MTYKYRYIARIVIEAETPLAIGGENKEFNTDRPVAKDANGLPYIPGTSLAGVLRHAVFATYDGKEEEIEKLNDILGHQEEEENENSVGSRISISSAHLIGKNGKVYDGLLLLSELSDGFIDHFLNLPVRQHVRMTHKGVADTKKKGKFDEEILYKGSRLIFEIEMKGTEESQPEDSKLWKEMLKIFMYPDFRLGSGSRKGFGKIKVINIKHKTLDISKEEDRNKYLEHSSCLDSTFDGNLLTWENSEESKYISYTLNLTPEDFYFFGSGKKINSIDLNPVTEKIITWDNTQENPDFSDPDFLTEQILIPASSVKGAVSHRVAFHYNKLCGIYADKLPQDKTIEDYVGENNVAVKALFGEASNHAENKCGQRGNVLISDVFRGKSWSFKKLDHVAIDRFTGGAIDGALFHENVIKDNSPFILNFELEAKFTAPEGSERKKIIEAFETTLKDICSGSLPLGGGTMRGHGIFTGTLEKN